jgi:branched-chain amino acid transport system ATP-binding protein
MLKVNNIGVVYMNAIQVLMEVSLEVGDGNIVALLGANGAGKTTTLKAISGLLKTEEGKVTVGRIDFEGRRIDKYNPEDIAAMGISQVMEGRKVLENLSVEENLLVGAHCHKDRAGIKRDMNMVFDYFPILKNLRRQMSGYLSGGEQQMLVIGRGLMTRPKLVLLDEPSLGLAPLLVQEIYEIIKRINTEQRTSMLLVEQNAVVALDVSDYGYVMENGKVVLNGTAEKLKGNENVKEFYLGLTSVGGKKNYREVKHYKRRKYWIA